MPSYRTTAGPERGSILWKTLAFDIGVHEDDNLMPTGLAMPVSWDDQDRTVFTLTVRGEELPGRWVVVDRRFVEADAGEQAGEVR